MDQLINLQPRSSSVPRTSKRHKVQVHSDSQITYSVNNLKNNENEHKRHKSDPGQRRLSRKSMKLSRSKRISRSFVDTFGIDKFEERRSVTLEHRNVLPFMVTNNQGFAPNSITAALLSAHQTLKLSCPLLPLDITPQVSTPLVVEDPPSSDNASDLEEDTVRYNLDPVFLNGSSTSGSAGARSAPSTPQGVPGSAAGGASSDQQQPGSPGYLTASIPRSPSHIFGKYDKGALKQLSSSTPTMTAQARSPEPPSPKGTKEKMPAGSSKARQKKFHRHFTQVDDEERVLNYYSCALVGDILLQGHLYITKNYFAFYSNVFGYVTKLLIPITSVMKISKEKTARIIPNAVGVATADDKHVFGSLLSRDSTYKLMTLVLKAAKSPEPVVALPEPKDIRPGELDASEFSADESSSQSGNDSPTVRGAKSIQRTGAIPIITKTSAENTVVDGITKIPLKSRTNSLAFNYKLGLMRISLPAIAKYNVCLLIGTLLLLSLFTSACILLYRISRMQSRYSQSLQDAIMSPTSDIYNEILHWQDKLHTKSAGAVHSFLDSNLDQIAKVRKSLEALSTLLVSNNPADEHEADHESKSTSESNKEEQTETSSAATDG